MGDALRRPLLVCLLVAFASGQVGCVVRAYDGPARPRPEVARLELATARLEGPVQRQLVRFVSVDDRPLSLQESDDEVEVLPGSHQVVVAVLWRNHHREQIATAFDVEAGRTYRFEAQSRNPEYDVGDWFLDGPGIILTPWNWAWFKEPGEERPTDVDTAIWVIELDSAAVVWGSQPEWAFDAPR